MEKFIGSKFRPTGRVTITHDPHTNEVITKDEFGITKSYAQYLEQLYIEGLEVETKRLKARLEREAHEYGECDQVEFQRYLSLLNQIYDLKHPAQKKVAKSGCIQPMKYSNVPQPYLPQPTK